MKKQNTFILLGVILLFLLPFVLKPNGSYEGSDAQAEVVIEEVSPGYKPWMESLWEPPSGEVESLLFALQAALGAGVMGYVFGYLKGKKKGQSLS